MRTFTTSAVCLMLAALLLAFGPVGCKTSEPGVRSTHVSQYTTVGATPPDATDAAESALSSLNLKDVKSKSTDVDGWASGYTADHTKVMVNIESTGAKTSQVTVTVGTAGDPDLGMKIVKKIQDNLGEND